MGVGQGALTCYAPAAACLIVKTLAFVIGLLIIAVGAVGVFAPSSLLWIAQHPVTSIELYISLSAIR